MGPIRRTHVSSPRDSIRVIDSGRISNPDLSFCETNPIFRVNNFNIFDINIVMGILVNESGASDGLGNNYLLLGKNNVNLHQTRVPGLESGILA